MRVAAIIPAAGRGKRLKSRLPKAFVTVCGKPLIVHTLRNLLSAYPFEEVVVLVEKTEVGRARKVLDRHRLTKVRVETGGATRADSVKRGLLTLRRDPEWALIHDAARPLISRQVVRRTLAAAERSGAALCVLPVTSTVKRLRDARNVVSATEDRSRLCLAQTPQVFRVKLLLARYRALGPKALEATDEAALFDNSKVQVRVVAGESRNIKVTTREDLEWMKYSLKK